MDKIAILLFFVLLTMATFCFGGNPVKGPSDNSDVKLKDSCTLVSFTAREVESKIYINWNVISPFNDFYFVLERSTDGKNYSIANVRKGYISPCGQPLQFSFTDVPESVSGMVYYKIKLQKINGADEKNHLAILSSKDLFNDYPNSFISLPVEIKSVTGIMPFEQSQLK
jgi:hypothetical protein